MGNASGIVSKVISQDDRKNPIDSPCITDKLFEIMEILIISSDFRELFVEYFFSASWIPKFIDDKAQLRWEILFPTLFEDRNNDLVKSSFRTTCSNEFFTHFNRNSPTVFTGLSQENSIALLVICAVPYFLSSIELHAWKNDEGNALHQTIVGAILLPDQFPLSAFSSKSRRRLSSSCDDDCATVVTERSSGTINLSVYSDPPLGRAIVRQSSIREEAETSFHSRDNVSSKNVDITSLEQDIRTVLRNFAADRLFYTLSNTEHLLLRQVLRLLYDHPYAISIATVSSSFNQLASQRSKKSIGQYFPIAYVNHMYEKLLQFKYTDLNGFNINCLFNSSVAGDEAVDAFENSLEEMKAFQTLMKMERRSGEIVDTWLATCPVYSAQQQAYTHLIMVHQPLSLNATSTTSSPSASLQPKLKNSDDLEALLVLLHALFLC